MCDRLCSCFQSPGMDKKLESRAWSCGTLLCGAAQVVDMASLPHQGVVDRHEQQLLAELETLSPEELQRALEDNVFRCHSSVCITHSLQENEAQLEERSVCITHSLQENEAQLEEHGLSGHLGSLAGA